MGFILFSRGASYTLSKPPIHLSFICIYHFDTLSLVEWQDTCHACGSLVWPCSPRVSRDSVVFGGVWRVMGSTPVGCTENSFPEYFDLRTLFIVYTLSKSPIHVRQCLTTLSSTFKLVKVLRAARGIFNCLSVWKYDQINKLTSVFYASFLLLIMNFLITLSN